MSDRLRFHLGPPVAQGVPVVVDEAVLVAGPDVSELMGKILTAWAGATSAGTLTIRGAKLAEPLAPAQSPRSTRARSRR